MKQFHVSVPGHSLANRIHLPSPGTFHNTCFCVFVCILFLGHFISLSSGIDQNLSFITTVFLFRREKMAFFTRPRFNIPPLPADDVWWCFCDIIMKYLSYFLSSWSFSRRTPYCNLFYSTFLEGNASCFNCVLFCSFERIALGCFYSYLERLCF